MPLVIDIFCGLGGWAEGFISEGYRVKGYDIEKHDYGKGTYPGELFLCDARSLHGSQFADATCIVASPPCQEPSYRAMPWKRAKALNAIGPPHKFIELFNTCFRIQREASEAAGRYIPLIVENVKGAQPWVGRARWHYGSFYLWGDVPALMPITFRGHKVPGFRFDGSGGSFQTASVNATGLKLPGNNSADRWSDRPIQRLKDATKVPGQNWINFNKTGEVSPHWRMQSQNVSVLHADRDSQGVKQHGSGPVWWRTGNGAMPSASKRRKAASAEIAKIPFPLAQHIARSFRKEAI